MNCPDCEGTGRSANPGQSCFFCNGSGRLCDRCGESCRTDEELCDRCRAESEGKAC